jgi:chromosome segregation ATPase
VSDADDIAALRITIEEMLDAATIERLGVDDSRDIHTCVLRICSELRSVEAERDRLHRSLDNFINSNANLSEQLSAQTARAAALEALNATMHERISGLVAEIAQAKERETTLRQWVTMYRDELEGCAKVIENTDTIGAALLRTRVASLSQLISGGKIPQGEHLVFRPI